MTTQQESAVIPSQKFSFRNLQAIFLRILYEPTLIEQFHKNIDPEKFAFGQTDPKTQSLKVLIKSALEYYENDIIGLLNIPAFTAKMATHSDSDVNKAARSLLNEMLDDDELLALSKNDGIVQVFIDLLKVFTTQDWSKKFNHYYTRNQFDNAIKSMETFLTDIEKIKMADDEDGFNYDDVYTMFEDEADEKIVHLPTGIEEFDYMFNGGLEPSTLNLFVAESGKGKSQMCSYLVQQCVTHKIYAHFTIVEDRKKTFIPRVLAGLTGISIKRLKHQFKQLTDDERAKFHHAVLAMKEYIKLEFMYDKTIDDIHRNKLEYIKSRKAQGKPLPVVDGIDYTGHVATTAAGDKVHEKYLSAYTKRKNFCLKYEQIGIDFAQVNRDGSKKGANGKEVCDVLTKNDLASAFDLIRVIDNMISINRNDDMMQKNKAILYLAKTKDGGELDGCKYEVDTDFDHGRYNMKSAVNLTKINWLGKK